jgi:ribose 1,5-bisphosphokinase PhnN
MRTWPGMIGTRTAKIRRTERKHRSVVIIAVEIVLAERLEASGRLRVEPVDRELP